MVVVNLSFESMCDIIQPTSNSETEEWNHSYHFLNVKSPRSFIRKKIRKIIKQKHPTLWNKLDSRAGGNASRHGRSPYHLKLVIGKNGYVIQVKDHGKGYDVSQVIEKYLSRKKYFHHLGMGWRYFMSPKYWRSAWSVPPQVYVSVQSDGKQINVMHCYHFDETVKKHETFQTNVPLTQGNEYQGVKAPASL